MSTITRGFTKEQLIEKLQHRIAVAAKYPDLEEAQLDAAIFKIALASLEAEAVGEVVLGEYDDCGCHPDARVACIAADGQADWENFKDGTRLYTAPPVPVSVPAAMEMDDDFDSAFEHGKAVGWNAYRAAMLQSFGNSEQLNSPVIQDGSEDTKRLDWLDAQNKRLNEYYWTTYGWKFDANFQRNAMMLNDSNYPVMTVRQAIDEAIAAAPQQEVK
ncbi:hypothetical protein [Enterobacter hormaechei]|uniref:hypothetical protein n=1 Tax=Enterobacter hormaechei TaxID=158836 RepID=UPI00215A364B|nr:hypothetical protein [Enterobacter hormaechei]